MTIKLHRQIHLCISRLRDVMVKKKSRERCGEYFTQKRKWVIYVGTPVWQLLSLNSIRCAKMHGASGALMRHLTVYCHSWFIMYDRWQACSSVRWLLSSLARSATDVDSYTDQGCRCMNKCSSRIHDCFDHRVQTRCLWMLKKVQLRRCWNSF